MNGSMRQKKVEKRRIDRKYDERKKSMKTTKET